MPCVSFLVLLGALVLLEACVPLYTFSTRSEGAQVTIRSSVDLAQVAEGTLVTVTAPAVQGFVFDGWKDQGSYVDDAAQRLSYTFAAYGNMDLVAHYSPLVSNIFVYMDGDNNLDSYALLDFKEMEAADLRGTGINVVVLLDRLGSYNSRVYQVGHDASPDSGTGFVSDRVACPPLGIGATGNTELDMGAQATLKNFAAWALGAYPAPSNTLIIWNHGGGWRSAAAGNGLASRELCFDESSASVLYTRDLGTALEDHSFQVIGFDLCLLGMMEVVYELREKADYMVASEESIPGTGWDYTDWLLRVKAGNGTALDIARAAVDSFGRQYSGYAGLSQTAYDLGTIDVLYEKLMAFSSALASVVADQYRQASVRAVLTQDARKISQSGQYFNVDMHDLASQFASGSTWNLPSADALMDALKMTVAAEWHAGSALSDLPISAASPSGCGLSLHVSQADPSEFAGFECAYCADHLILSPSTTRVPSFVDAPGNTWVPNVTAQTGLLYKVFLKKFVE